MPPINGVYFMTSVQVLLVIFIGTERFPLVSVANWLNHSRNASSPLIFLRQKPRHFPAVPASPDLQPADRVHPPTKPNPGKNKQKVPDEHPTLPDQKPLPTFPDPRTDHSARLRQKNEINLLPKCGQYSQK